MYVVRLSRQRTEVDSIAKFRRTTRSFPEREPPARRPVSHSRIMFPSIIIATDFRNVVSSFRRSYRIATDERWGTPCSQPVRRTGRQENYASRLRSRLSQEFTSRFPFLRCSILPLCSTRAPKMYDGRATKPTGSKKYTHRKKTVPRNVDIVLVIRKCNNFVGC